jgi:CPA1 family monovalent cation:H+ antiporter
VSPLEFILLILALLGPVLALAKMAGLPATLVLFALGLGTALLPGLPAFRMDPALLTGLFLPPLLYASTVRVTWHLLRFTLGRGVLAGVALSVATTLAVAALARVLLPELGWNAAILLGIVAALFDTRLFHEAKGRPLVPRAMADVMKAREMVGRLVALTAFALVMDTLREGEAPGLAEGVLQTGWQLLGGAAAGFGIGWAIVRLRARAEPPPVEIAVSIATPYLCAFAARELDLSVVMAVSAAALVVAAAKVDRETGEHQTSSPEARLSAMAFWEVASLVVSSLLFFMAGRALPEAVAALERWPLVHTAGAAAAILALVLLMQFAANLLTAPVGERRVAAAWVMSWAATRSVIGLLVALSVPGGEGFAPERDLVLVVGSFVVLGSVLLQGLTLGVAVRRAALGNKDEAKQEEELAIRRGAEAARGQGPEAARREALLLRERDRIGDETLHKVLREADLQTRAAEGPGRALPGAGPPNP